ncbi:MAG TPA: CRTAC1 family protein, partial [Thermoanaerobaculia bacterium]|nr:CRTAC1 family protein [Thermoanaerobaculia bacterium]
AALYRNLGDGRFADVTREAGLSMRLLGMGAAVGDLDNDGDLDLLVTAVGGDHLFENLGHGRFQDVSQAWGLGPGGFSSSAAFLDYDRDGWLDLFLGRYVAWDPATERACQLPGGERMYCTPELFAGVPSRLLHNLGGRRFEDVSERSGVGKVAGKVLGVVSLDADGDGWPDLAVASDTAPNLLWRNRHDGTFEEIGQLTGMALSDSGAPRGGMGIDAGDLDGDGRPDLAIGNFAQEMSGLYRAGANGLYADQAAESGVGLPSLMQVSFGTLFLDQDGDGHLDLIQANGHIEPAIARLRPAQTYAQPLQLFRNRGDGTFAPVEPGPAGAAGAWQGPWVGRGLATADYDGDGDLDLVLTQNGGPARLLRNNANPAHWLAVRLAGGPSNRTAYGARVTAVAGNTRQVRWLASGRSYLSASDPLLSFYFGSKTTIDRLEILWPSGATQIVRSPALRQVLLVHEGH